jgi:hypothetical protein
MQAVFTCNDLSQSNAEKATGNQLQNAKINLHLI